MSFHSSLSSGSTYGSHRGSTAVGDHLRSGFICGRGSYAVGDHWRSNLGFISGLGVICGRGSFAVGDQCRSNLGFISGLGVICGRGSWCYTPAVEYICQVANRLTRLFLACELSIVRGNSKENIGVSQKATHILLNITEVSKCPAITVSKSGP